MADAGKLKLSLDEVGIGEMSLDGFDLGKYASCVEYRAPAGELATLTVTLSFIDIEAELKVLPESITVLINDLREGGKFCTAENGKITTVKASA